MTKERTTFYYIGQVLAGLAGLLTIVFIVLAFVGVVINIGGNVFLQWLINGGFGLTGNVWLIVSIVCAVVLLIITIGSAFREVNGIIIGIIVLLLGIFQPGIAGILCLVACICFIIDGIA